VGASDKLEKESVINPLLSHFELPLPKMAGETRQPSPNWGAISPERGRQAKRRRSEGKAAFL
jgi:hypothetical protein